VQIAGEMDCQVWQVFSFVGGKASLSSSHEHRHQTIGVTKGVQGVQVRP